MKKKQEEDIWVVKLYLDNFYHGLKLSNRFHSYYGITTIKINRFMNFPHSVQIHYYVGYHFEFIIQTNQLNLIYRDSGLHPCIFVKSSIYTEISDVISPHN